MPIEQIVPSSWMPPAKMVRIIFHWTGGAYMSNATDRRAYHLLVERQASGHAKLVRGDFPISANVNPQPGKYAAHTARLNTGSIGISVCCMGGREVREFPFNAGPYPMTREQWNLMIFAGADCCRAYGIPVGPRTTLSHAEVEGTLGVKQANKWDFTRLAFDLSLVGAKACGDKLRADLAAVLAGRSLPGSPIPPQDPQRQTDPTLPPVATQFGTVIADWLNLRHGPGTIHEIRGGMPKGTRLAILARNGDWMRVRTPAGYEGWVHSAYVRVA